MYSVDTTIRGASRGSADAFYAWAKEKGAKRLPDVRLYLDTIYDLAPKIGMRAEICVGQSVHETTDVDTGAPWASYWFVQRLNPAGAGVTGDAAQDAVSPTFASGEASARYQMAHLWLYAVGTSLPAELKESDDPRWQNAVSAGYPGTAPTLGGLNGKWAVDPEGYGQKISRRLNAMDAAGLLTGTNTITPPKEDTAVVTAPTAKTYSNDVAGLPGGPLLTDYKITQQLIPDWNTLQNPGILLSQQYDTTQHGTGNPNSTAASEARWLVDQRADGAQTSVHFFADDQEVKQVLPVNRVAWHAADGGGPGNMNTVACECIESDAVWNLPARIERIIYINADLMGRIAARKGGGTDPRYHWTWNFADPNRHPCPDKILFGKPEWKATYVKQWHASRLDELERMKNGGVVEVIGGVIDDILHPPFDWSKAAKPYPIPALSSTDVNKGDTAPGVISKDGTDFVFVSDVVEATADIPRLQYADAHAPHTGPDIKTGERFVGAWLFKAGDGSFYYLSSAPFWSRIPAKNTKRVADAPLKGTA